MPQKLTLTIADMQELAKRKNGKCLSPTFINYTTKLLWECASGHRWETKPHNIKFGSWCPVCAKQKQRFWNHQQIQDK
jgi:hypothetical protein